MLRLRFAALMLVAGLLTSGYLMGEDKKGDSQGPIFVKGRLPRYYSKLSLSDKQKNQIYKIRYDYATQIKKLQEQIAALRDKEKTDVANVLTAAQKARLKELQSGGSSKAKEVKDKPAEIKKP